MFRITSSFRVASLAAFVLLATSCFVSAWAFTPQGVDNSYEVLMNEYHLAGYKSADVTDGSLAATQSLSNRYGGNWNVYLWNPQSKSPSYLYGSGVDLAQGLYTSESAVAVAREVIAANPDVFHADLANLEVHRTPTGMGKRAVHFKQMYQGLEVWQGRVHLTFTEAGRLFVMGSDYYNDIELDTNPTLSLKDAEAIATGTVPFDLNTDYIEEGATLMVLPEPLSPNSVKHHLVWRIRVRTESPLGLWVTHVDAHTGEIIWRFNDIHFVDFDGTATSNVQFGTYCDGINAEAAKYLRIQVSGIGETTTDQFGLWNLPYGGSDLRTVTADLYGPYIDVNNMASGAPEGEFSGSFMPGSPIPVILNDLNAQRDERDCFAAINDIHDFIGQFDPTYSYTNQRITCNVSRSQTCNAYWDGTINFYNEGGGCGNTGEMQGVAHHEFGHGVQDNILGYQGGEGLGEGNGDILANLMTNDHHIGRGFYLDQCDSGIRNSLNTLTYPDDVVGQPIHSAGRVIAGFNWDFMVLLQGQYGDETGATLAGERWHFGRILELPTTQPAQVLATFIADDDDGNLDNGTPHHGFLCEAATNHNFDCPAILVGVHILHTPVVSHEAEGDVTVTATIFSYTANLVPSSLLLTYRVNEGSFVETVLTPTGNPDEFSAVIPGLVQTSEVEYYISGADEDEYEAVDPPGAPLDLHTFVVAPQEVIVVDDIESGSPGWTHETGSAGFTDQWHISTTRNHTTAGGYSWKCGDAGALDYASLLDAVLISPVFELLSHSYLHYWQWIDSEESSAHEGRAYDGGLLEISVDGGPWTQLFPDGDYTHTIRAGSTPGPFDEGTDVYAGSSDWHQVNFNLADFEGNAQLRLRFGSDGADTREGWYIDDIVIDGFVLSLAAVDDNPTSSLRFALHGSRTNPIVGATDIRFQIPATIDVDLAVYDVTGRSVRSLASESFSAGDHTVSWDGNDAAGQLVPSGVYYVRMQAGAFTTTRKLVVSH
jgi:FlgD Ig-like domain/Fungalysin/Thermolysin Propeptide Motif